MKKGCLIAGAAFLLLALVTAASLTWIVVRHRAPSVDKGSFVEIDLSGEIPEHVSQTSLLGEDPLSMEEVGDLLHWAEEDSRVSGIVVRVEPLALGWGKLEELREELGEVEAHGKTVVAFLEEGDDAEYYLATAADKIFMPPMGQLGINGLDTELEFYRGLFDKIGLAYDGVAIGEFKSAPEHYTRQKMSDREKEEYTALLDGLYQHYVDDVAAARKLTPEQVKGLIDGGPYSAVHAKDLGLIDQTYYWDEFEEWVKGTSPKKPEIVEADKLRSLAAKSRAPGALSGSSIAVVYASGEIVSGESDSGGTFGDEAMGSDTIAEALKDARDDDSVKAVVLRVDSPGGSVVASDVIWRAVQVTKAKKPVVVSMSDLAASGGYYIAMGASAIVAQPGSITGSIGIFSGKFVTKGLYDKVGLSTDGVKRGQYADMFSSNRLFTPEERTKIHKDLEEAYGVFLAKAADGRGLDTASVDRIARGRVWLGERGKALGLVDELGGLAKAIEVAKTKAKLAGEPAIVTFPRKKSLWERLSETKGVVEASHVKVDLPPPFDRAMAESRNWAHLKDGEPMMMLPYRVRIR